MVMKVEDTRIYLLTGLREAWFYDVYYLYMTSLIVHSHFLNRLFSKRLLLLYKVPTMLIEEEGGDSSKMYSHFLRAWVISRKLFQSPAGIA